MVEMEPFLLKDELHGAGACRNAQDGLSALLAQIRRWLEAGDASKVPERIQHAFLHVRDYAQRNGGSLEVDFVQKEVNRSVTVASLSQTSSQCFCFFLSHFRPYLNLTLSVF